MKGSVVDDAMSTRHTSVNCDLAVAEVGGKGFGVRAMLLSFPYEAASASLTNLVYSVRSTGCVNPVPLEPRRFEVG